MSNEDNVAHVDQAVMESSSSEDEGRADTDSDSSPGPPPRKKRRRHVDSGDSDLDRRFEILSQQLVSHVQNYLYSNLANIAPAQIPTSIATCVPSTSTAFAPRASAPAPSAAAPFLLPPPMPKLDSGNIAELNVVVKEPTVAKAIPDRVTKISEMQRFSSVDWNSVRYTDIQKKYVAFPAFTELKVNEELRQLEDSLAPIRWFLMERSFAALSNAFLGQNECVNLALQNLIDWSARSDVQLSPTTLYEKLKELFSNESAYKTVSHDILQMICGKRAEVIELRRRSILKALKSKFVKEDLEKIPPSPEYIFDPQPLSSYIQKIGGIEKLEKQAETSKFSRPKSPVASTSRQNKPFRPATGAGSTSAANKSRQQEKKESDSRRDDGDSAASKKRGGRNHRGGKGYRYKNK